MTILFYLVLGLIAGAIAKAILPGRQGGGILMTIVLGVVGALAGGLIFNFIAGKGFDLTLYSGWFWSLITAVIGSIIVLAIYGAVSKRTAS